LYTISFNFPNLPKDGEIDITGLDQILLNGRTYRVNDEVDEHYRASNPVVLAEGGYGPGPSLVEAFAGNEHVTVEFTEGGEV